jgi:hypothetical protein
LKYTLAACVEKDRWAIGTYSSRLSKLGPFLVFPFAVTLHHLKFGSSHFDNGVTIVVVIRVW